jgi:hypothetical protein
MVRNDLMMITVIMILGPQTMTAQSLAFDSTNLEKYWSAGIFYDQDYTLEWYGLKKLNEDRNYTMGLGLYYSSISLGKCFVFKPEKWINKLLNHRMFSKGISLKSQPSYSLMLADGAFTPDSLPARYIITNDRPYASITYLQMNIVNSNYKPYRNYISSFSVGLLGIPVSREVQTYLHKQMNDHDTKPPRTPRGWHNQISKGGELTFAYSYAKEMLLTKKYINGVNPEKSFGLEVKHGYKYSLGYYTYLGYEVDARIGWFNARNWTYNINPLSNNDKAFLSTLGKDHIRPFELYLFQSIRPVFILYNALLNGQFRESAYKVNSAHTRHLIVEFNSGLGVGFGIDKRSSVDFKIKFSGRSPEFKLPGRLSRFHYWGGLDMIFSHN